MVTPGQTITPPPNQQSSPMRIGRPVSMRMVGCQQLAVGPDKRVRADGNTSTIQEDAVKIDKRTFAYADSVAVVAMEWRTNNHRRMGIRDEGFNATM